MAVSFNGLVPAIAARMISEGKSVKPGVHFLADAVDPIAFMAEPKNARLERTEGSDVACSSRPAKLAYLIVCTVKEKL